MLQEILGEKAMIIGHQDGIAKLRKSVSANKERIDLIKKSVARVEMGRD